jgi:Cu(I)-responsive transcriptional regulator
MNIGEAARLSGVSSKAIRYYESIDLILPSGRAENNYRDFSDQDVHRLRFVNRARSLGFSLAEVGELLSLYNDPNRTSSEVKSIAKVAIDRIDAKLVELSAMRDTLATLSAHCHGDDKPDCPILNDLAGDAGTK